MQRVPRRFMFVTVLLTGLTAVAASVWAQIADNQSGGLFGQGPGEEVVLVAAQFTAPADGQPGQLFVTATIKPGWHIYSITQPPGGPLATKIKLNDSASFRLLGEFQVSPAPVKKREPAFDNMIVESHDGRVVWSAPIEFASGVDPAALKIEGQLNVQPCDPNNCLPPRDFPFTAVLKPGVGQPGEGPYLQQPLTAGQQSDTPAFDPNTLQADDAQLKKTPLIAALAMGLVGGLILNLMPCVLPVIGLKVLSFVQQAGQSRREAFVLNVWYSLGLMSVFLLLAVLAVTLGMGWGQLFTYKEFNIALVAVVFAMALSLLGVWDIPIPGFVGSGKAVQLAEKEGAGGAFAKGVLTTILATPCSAPFLASALFWTASQPPAAAYAVFLSAGLGMASPYLLIGAFPELTSFLPKPGAWMDTFKQVMGFGLFIPVVWVLTFLPIPHVIPTVALLFALWFAVWLIGRIPVTASFNRKTVSWATAIAVVVVSWFFSFGWLAGEMEYRYERALQAHSGSQSKYWRAFTRAAMDEAIAAQDTVMVDFTADWCATCKTLEKLVLDTDETRGAIDAGGVATFLADWTHAEPEVTATLELLGSKQVPVLAIFPAGKPNPPLVLRGFYTQRMLLDALKKAGPSKGSAE